MRDQSHTCLSSPLLSLVGAGICIPTPLILGPESERMWPLTGRKQLGPLGQIVLGVWNWLEGQFTQREKSSPRNTGDGSGSALFNISEEVSGSFSRAGVSPALYLSVFPQMIPWQ